jgi:hypothetical protein
MRGLVYRVWTNRPRRSASGTIGGGAWPLLSGARSRPCARLRHTMNLFLRSLSLLSTLAIVGLAVGLPASAAAQTTITVSAAWAPADAPAAPAEVEADAPTHHEPRRGLLIAGAVPLITGYVLSVIWGSFYLAETRLGPLGCNDTYAGWHYLPVAGALIGMLAGGQCVPDTLHVEEALVPAISTAAQLAGLVLVLIGAAGRQVPDVPPVALSIDANGAYLATGGTF